MKLLLNLGIGTNLGNIDGLKFVLNLIYQTCQI